MKIKHVAAVVAVCLMTLVLTACSGGKQGSSLEKIKEKGSLVVATSPDYAPFEFQTLRDGKNQIVGSDILLAQKIADHLGVRLEISPMNFDNVLTSVQNGKADLAIAGLSYTEERVKVFDFTESYYQVSDVLLMPTSKAGTVHTMADLAGLRIAVQKGSSQEAYAKNHLKDSQLISLTQIGEAVNELKVGHVEAVLLDGPVALGYAANNRELVLADLAFPTSVENAKAIVLKKGTDDLKEVLNQLIQEMNDRQQYQQFLEEAAQWTVVE